jgi:trehalose 6-phosphate phosphatase
MDDVLPYPRISGRPWALFLDIDGTLIDIAPRPGDIFVPPELNILLDRLHARFNGACALVSGRDLGFIDSALGWRRDAAGCHGAEFRFNGVVVQAVPDRELLAEATERLIKAAAFVPGSLVEIKGQSIAFHYGATAFTEAQARVLVDEAAGIMSHAFRIVCSKKAVELLPKGTGKDRAVAEFMRHKKYAGKIPVFAGDDSMDEEAFREVNAVGGISIFVGERTTTAAYYRVRSVAKLRRWLTELVSEGTTLCAFTRGGHQ